MVCAEIQKLQKQIHMKLLYSMMEYNGIGFRQSMSKKQLLHMQQLGKIPLHRRSLRRHRENRGEIRPRARKINKKYGLFCTMEK